MEKEFCDQTKYPKIALIILIVFVAILAYLLYTNYQDKMFFFIFLSVFVIFIVSALWIYMTSFSINISGGGVMYELKSFSTEKKYIPFEDILQITLVPLDFTTKFGGWGKRKNKNEIAYIFNDGYFLEIKTPTNIYYFSISDDKKDECLKFIDTLKV